MENKFNLKPFLNSLASGNLSVNSPRSSSLNLSEINRPSFVHPMDQIKENRVLNSNTKPETHFQSQSFSTNKPSTITSNQRSQLQMNFATEIQTTGNKELVNQNIIRNNPAPNSSVKQNAEVELPNYFDLTNSEEIIPETNTQSVSFNENRSGTNHITSNGAMQEQKSSSVEAVKNANMINIRPTSSVDHEYPRIDLAAPGEGKLDLSNMKKHKKAKECQKYLNDLLSLSQQRGMRGYQTMISLVQFLIDENKHKAFSMRLRKQLNMHSHPLTHKFLATCVPVLQQKLSAGTIQISGIRAPVSKLVGLKPVKIFTPNNKNKIKGILGKSRATLEKKFSSSSSMFTQAMNPTAMRFQQNPIVHQMDFKSNNDTPKKSVELQIATYSDNTAEACKKPVVLSGLADATQTVKVSSDVHGSVMSSVTTSAVIEEPQNLSVSLTPIKGLSSGPTETPGDVSQAMFVADTPIKQEVMEVEEIVVKCEVMSPTEAVDEDNTVELHVSMNEDSGMQEESPTKTEPARQISNLGGIPPSPAASSGSQTPTRRDSEDTSEREHYRLELVGKNWGEKFKLFPTMHRIFAEKIVKDVLFEAKLGTLNRESRFQGKTKTGRESDNFGGIPPSPAASSGSRTPTRRDSEDYREREHYRLELFGKILGEDLKQLPTKQRIFAEKIVNDVMFETELGNVDRESHFP